MWPVMNQWYMNNFGAGKTESHHTSEKTVVHHGDRHHESKTVHHEYKGGKQIFNGMSITAYLDVMRSLFNSEADRTGNVQ